MTSQMQEDVDRIAVYSPGMTLERTYLVVLFHRLPRAAGAGLPVDSSTPAVAPTALHKKASWEEDRIGQL